ncbi:MAG: hypothetical protein WCQ95_01710 [Bacteroidota bacterium]
MTVLLLLLIACNSSTDVNLSAKKTRQQDKAELNRKSDSTYKLIHQKLFSVIKEQELFDKKFEAYRLYLDRAFHYAMVFRIEKEKQSVRLFVKTFKQRHFDIADSKDSLISVSLKKLRENDWNDFKKNLELAKFWTMNPGTNEGKGCFDGSYWTLEGYVPSTDSTRAMHYFVTRFCPKDGYFRKACLKLIELSGELDTNEVY